MRDEAVLHGQVRAANLSIDAEYIQGVGSTCPGHDNVFQTCDVKHMSKSVDSGRTGGRIIMRLFQTYYDCIGMATGGIFEILKFCLLVIANEMSPNR